MRDYLVPVYTAYLVSMVGLVVWLARTLYRNGAVFLREVFEDRPEMAEAVNHLLVTGFAMVNLGYGFFLVNGDDAGEATTAFQVLARKLGILLLSLATVHFVNLFAFHRIANRRRQATLAPPVAPQRWVDNDPEPPTWVAPRPGTTQLPPPPIPPARPAHPPVPGFGPAPA